VLRRIVGAPKARNADSLPVGDEARLLSAARTGDARAMGRLLTALAGPAYRFGRGFCRDHHDAEEVMQEVLSALARSVSRYRGDASLTSWAYVVARRVCMRHRRRRSAEPRHLASLEESSSGGTGNHPEDPGADPLDRLERRELGAVLERAIVALPQPQREVLVLRDVEGLSARVVGRALRIGERAVKSRLHRARMALRRSLAPQLASQAPAPEPGAEREGGGCPETALQVSRYLEGEMTPARCAALAAHVEGCAACRAECAALRAALGACRAWGRGPLPPGLREQVREAIRRALGDKAGIARGRART